MCDIQIGLLALFGPVNATVKNPVSSDAGVILIRRDEFREWLKVFVKSIEHYAAAKFF